jgi:mannose-6-phosphate isomerase-like protein (cupin superfamily)
MPGPVRTEIHLGANDTDGAFCLLVDHPPAGWSLPSHLHRGVAETIHIIDGEFEITVDGNRSRLSAGETIHVPADVIHSGGNVGSGAGRRLVIFSPAGMESFFLEAGSHSEEVEPEPAAALAAAARHGWRFVNE